jgi:hypothetical protein
MIMRICAGSLELTSFDSKRWRSHFPQEAAGPAFEPRRAITRQVEPERNACESSADNHGEYIQIVSRRV